MEQKQKPVQTFRYGLVEAVIWANETEHGVMHKVVLNRLYKDGEEWKHTTSFGRDDLPLVVKLADKAHTWIYEQQTS